MNAWLKRCVFNLDLNRKSVSEPRTISGLIRTINQAINHQSDGGIEYMFRKKVPDLDIYILYLYIYLIY